MRRALLALGLAACGSRRTTSHEVFDELPLDTPPGMSDHTLDDHGMLWSIAERERTMVRIDPATRKTERFPLEGVALGLDTEALTWLGDARFAIGTEGEDTPSAGVAFAELQAGHFVVTRTRELTSAELGVDLLVNHGVEGVCGHGDELLVAIETVGDLPDGGRFAPLVRIRGDAIAVGKVRLTSATGKISALLCTFAPDGTAQVLAIERHYGVSRLIRFEARPGERDITATLERDLTASIGATINLEGLARLPDGRLGLINDNQTSSVTGPTELLVLHPR